MGLINKVFGIPLGWIMWAISQVIKNYGWSIIVFTILIQLAMLPLTIKQKKSTAKTTAIGPWQSRLQKQYGNNRTKLAEEQQKLYNDAGVSMTGGCSSMLIQFPILFGLIDVIYKPLTHMLRFSSDFINESINLAQSLGYNIAQTQQEISVISAIKANPSQFDALGLENIQKILNFDLTFFGLDATIIPDKGLNLFAIVPILSAVTALLMSLYMEYIRRKSIPEGTQTPGGGSMIMMLLLSPIMSLWIGFSFPIGITLYWTVRNVISILQEFLINLFMPQKKLVEKATEDIKERLKDKERELKGKKKKNSISSDESYENMSDKEIARKKLAAARKRDAEKYGEEYIEPSDKDLT